MIISWSFISFQLKSNKSVETNQEKLCKLRRERKENFNQIFTVRESVFAFFLSVSEALMVHLIDVFVQFYLFEFLLFRVILRARYGHICIVTRVVIVCRRWIAIRH